jgi:hypothetical protein
MHNINTGLIITVPLRNIVFIRMQHFNIVYYTIFIGCLNIKGYKISERL